jgi:hypothetical protein
MVVGTKNGRMRVDPAKVLDRRMSAQKRLDWPTFRSFAYYRLSRFMSKCDARYVVPCPIAPPFSEGGRSPMLSLCGCTCRMLFPPTLPPNHLSLRSII